ncbi:MAG: DUF2207 domain-containing protein [Bacteroidales bacterium]|nr:DUF2207 domain-containing protein [Bacteroidales bacterium]
MKKTLILLLALIALSFSAKAQAIYSIEVDVLIDGNGDARITQTWDTESVDGTEWYIPIGHLGEMKIRDLTVSDETGAVYETLERWDVDKSLEQKKGKCGIVETGSESVEVCWGKGSYGHHVHKVAYTATGLVQGFIDYDAFNFKFINDDLSSTPGSVKVTIRNGTGKGRWTSENVKVWGFGFPGMISVTEKGEVVTYNTESLSRYNEVIVMCRFDKEMFEPRIVRNRPFSEMFNLAMEGSDYVPPSARIDSLHVSVLLEDDGSAFVMEQWYLCAAPGRWRTLRNSLKDEKMKIHDVSVKIDDVPLEETTYKIWKKSSNLELYGKYAFSENNGGRVKAIRWASGKDGLQNVNIFYYLDDAVKNLSDCDAFCHMFINENMNVSPDAIKIYVMNKKINPDTASVRTKGMEGRSGVINGGAYFVTKEYYDRDSTFLKMIVRLDDSVFNLPGPAMDKNYEEFERSAMKRPGESHHYDEGDTTSTDICTFIFLSLLGLFIGKKVWRKTGHVLHKGMFGTTKVTGWWRDIPLGGNMDAAATVLSRGWKRDNPYREKDLIGAYFLKWLQNGLLRVLEDPSGRKDRATLQFLADEIPYEAGKSETELFDMALRASGSNKILEKSEFNAWAKSHYTTVTTWNQEVVNRGMAWFRSQGIDAKLYGPTLDRNGQTEACRLLQFKNYLSDFTLISERQAGEVNLWKQYMIYGTLFGIAEKVDKAFKKLYPKEYAQYISGEGASYTPSAINVISNFGSSFVTTAIASKPSSYGSYSSSGRSSSGWSGGGGHTSSHGGGGYSGGGHGGGSR